MLPPLATGSEAYKLLHPSLNEALDQNTSAKRKISQSSKDNMVSVAGNTAPTPEMTVSPPFVPLGSMVSVGAKNKASSTVIATTQQDTLVETDASTAPEVPARTAVPAPIAAKAKVINVPVMVEEGGLTMWSDMMLKGHPGGSATNWEQWANSFSGQFKCVIDTITQSLRIKEDSYIKMFAEK